MPPFLPGSVPPPPTFINDPVTPKPATPYTPPAGYAGSRFGHNLPSPGKPMNGQGIEPGPIENRRVRVIIPEHPPAGMPEVRARLVILRGGKVGKEFLLYESEALIGRWDADGGIFPDIDLDQDDPEAKISRRHARLTQISGQFLIEDLGSTNGTYINRGPRLLPGIKQPLNPGDEIIVGKTFLKFFVS